MAMSLSCRRASGLPAPLAPVAADEAAQVFGKGSNTIDALPAPSPCADDAEEEDHNEDDCPCSKCDSGPSSPSFPGGIWGGSSGPSCPTCPGRDWLRTALPVG